MAPRVITNAIPQVERPPVKPPGQAEEGEQGCLALVHLGPANVKAGEVLPPEGEEDDDAFDDFDDDELREALLHAYRTISCIEDVLDQIMTHHERALPLRVRRKLNGMWFDVKEFLEQYTEG